MTVPANQNIEGTFAADAFFTKSSFMFARIYSENIKINKNIRTICGMKERKMRIHRNFFFTLSTEIERKTLNIRKLLG